MSYPVKRFVAILGKYYIVGGDKLSCGRPTSPFGTVICFNVETMKTERVPDMPYCACGPVTAVIHRGSDVDDDGADPAIVVAGADDVLSMLDYCILYNPVKRRFVFFHVNQHVCPEIIFML